jgi:hypothetical protein
MKVGKRKVLTKISGFTSLVNLCYLKVNIYTDKPLSYIESTGVPMADSRWLEPIL